MNGSMRSSPAAASMRTGPPDHRPTDRSAGARLKHRGLVRLDRPDEEVLLRQGHVVVTSTGLRCPPGLAYRAWERAGAKLSAISDSSAWCLGDWLIYGQTEFSDRYRIAVERVGLDYQTLRNYAWVARKYPLARRRPELSFQHHAELASVEPDEQDRWLELAAAGGWSRNRLRSELRGRPEEPAAAGDARHRTPSLRVPPEKLERWRQAAADVGLGLQEWIIVTLDSAVRPATG
jgi:hypothetical protein